MIPVDKQVPSPHFTKGRKSFKPEAIVVHIMEGTLVGTDAWFRDPISKVSAHFGIGRNGELHQYVDLANSAWHAGRVNNPTWVGMKAAGNGTFYNPNYYTIGIEHEGFGQTLWSDSMYNRSAELIAHLCVDFHIPLDRAHVVGHHEIYSIKSCTGQHVNFNILLDLARQYRTALIDGTAPPTPTPVSSIPALQEEKKSGSVKVLKNLNIRRKAPSTSAGIVSTAIAGSTLAYEGWVTNGQPIKGNRKWYFNQEGNYFWSGAAGEVG